MILRKLAQNLAVMSDMRPSKWIGHVLGEIRDEFARVRDKRSTKEQPSAVTQLPPRMHELSRLLQAAHENYEAPVFEGSAKLLRSSASPWSRRCLGWSDVTKGSVEVFDIPGEHWTALSEPAVALVGAYLRQWIEEECKHGPS
jgi:thioesterase domain-containing protein